MTFQQLLEDTLFFLHSFSFSENAKLWVGWTTVNREKRGIAQLAFFFI